VQRQAEPLGGVLALLGALFEDLVAAVAVRRGLIGYLSLLDDPFIYVPSDAIVPDSAACGDLSDIAAALAPRPVLFGLVDGRNVEAAARPEPGGWRLHGHAADAVMLRCNRRVRGTFRLFSDYTAIFIRFENRRFGHPRLSIHELFRSEVWRPGVGFERRGRYQERVGRFWKDFRLEDWAS
jgi:hypothetical protein